MVARLGLSQARRLALSGATIGGHQALEIGLAHQLVEDAEMLEETLEKQLQSVRACAPGALAATKQLLLASAQVSSDEDLNQLLDRGAAVFSDAIQGCEGLEGARAFLEKELRSGNADVDTTNTADCQPRRDCPAHRAHGARRGLPHRRNLQRCRP
ncbi:enoyl-CoA hydratase/isomerase family protein [Microbulbifer taiwanensis]|uniref:enoyl-CoA hydratase/isomerase family protein n=1 Tax=Microbulbifer taiwanensis TaxID=986746 RepID=UPI0036192DA3